MSVVCVKYFDIVGAEGWAWCRDGRLMVEHRMTLVLGTPVETYQH